MTKRIAILISGRGSNMTALLDAAASDVIAADIALVLSNKEDAAGLAHAAERGVETRFVDHRGKSREAFDHEVERQLEESAIDLVCLAGFMRIFSESFVERWQGRMVNIHPSLLPLFRGLNVHEQALDTGVALSGCTVHWVTAELDGGPIIGQAAVPTRAEDTPESLAKRVQSAEHLLYPRAVARVLGAPPSSFMDGDILVSIR
ncbi:MAG: phosphoribosylglycinamide formyltransferase [Pseudomonadota bacterium]